MKTFIIAEAGVNHNGSLEVAKKMVQVAKSAGADAVKFQTFITEKSISRQADKATYQKMNSPINESQFEMVKKLEINREAHVELIGLCKQIDIQFLSTPFDMESVEMLANLGMELFKIPSGEITNLLHLRKIASLKKKVILSTGMATLGEIEKALSVLTDGGVGREMITVLHCNTEYPTEFRDVNLRAMNTIRDAFKVNVGYSDHTLGIEVPIAAVALGASVIEKHFTLDRNMEGPDHKASLEPNELTQMIRSIRNIELAMGDGLKIPSKSEGKNINIARKSLHTLKVIEKGEMLTLENIISKRPGDGISPMEIDRLLGKRATHDLPEDYKLTYTDIA